MSLREVGLKEVCAHDKCVHKDCTLGGELRGLPSVAYRNPEGKTFVFHIGCAPPRLRRFYYQQERRFAS